VPEDFKLPVGNLQSTWQSWCLGSNDPEKGYPPLRKLDCIDMGDESVPAQRNKRRKLSDLKGLMGEMERVSGLSCSFCFYLSVFHYLCGPVLVFYRSSFSLSLSLSLSALICSSRESSISSPTACGSKLRRWSR
jgi:hypothetical protein